MTTISAGTRVPTLDTPTPQPLPGHGGDDGGTPGAPAAPVGPGFSNKARWDTAALALTIGGPIAAAGLYALGVRGDAPAIVGGAGIGVGTVVAWASRSRHEEPSKGVISPAEAMDPLAFSVAIGGSAVAGISLLFAGPLIDESAHGSAYLGAVFGGAAVAGIGVGVLAGVHAFEHHLQSAKDR